MCGLNKWIFKMEKFESLERKVALLQRFDNTAKAHTKAVEGLRDTIVKRVDEFLQFNQTHSADLLRSTQKLSQDSPPDSGERPSGEQGACCGEGTLPVVETYEDLVEYLRSLGAPSKSKLNLAAADDAEETLLSWSTDFDSFDDLEETLKPGMAAGGRNELDETLIALENTVDQFHRDFAEFRKVFRKNKKGGNMKSENPVEQCTKYWMKLVETLQASCSANANAKARPKRPSAEWTFEKPCFKEVMLLLRDGIHDQIEHQRQSLHQQKQLKKELKEDIKSLYLLSRELENRNLKTIEEIQKKHVNAKTSAAKECQQLILEVQHLHKKLQVEDMKARDALMSYSARSTDARPPVYTGDSIIYNQILQAALDSLNEIQSQKSDALISVANKLAVAEAAVDSLKSFVESDPVSRLSEVSNSLDVLLDQDKLFEVLETKVEGRTFKEWLPEIDQLLSERPPEKGISEK
ncbi:uncharacterized protein LOC119180908 isoform X2 [Rhipicephalus microplus]|uniref:uncharacterized protein LOC119180908 isoform X2 n=1 Tax=Rhipicephalus microplus TaxID=6941 RepID=UPI003F6B2057